MFGWGEEGEEGEKRSKSRKRFVREHPLDVALDSYGTRVRCIYLSKAPPSSPVVEKGSIAQRRRRTAKVWTGNLPGNICIRDKRDSTILLHPCLVDSCPDE